ncbi:CHAD domain-containing protein [Novosphingobium aquimarinum]|uniref:CHAD domain-containing protein n=1 Tax=Novosphingobium aquimarinum TaxID=2682494 RepID=UPI0012EC5330|nr:CHAD domain-containing protein [Novosphingobium aquimarinum]
MAYRLKRKDKSVEDALRRIACEQIDRGLRAIAEAETAVAVHDVRKRCKKLRGLARMVRPAFSDFATENAAFRDIAGRISQARDAKVMQDTYDALMEHFAAQVDRSALGSIRRRFTLDLKATRQDGLGDALGEVESELRAARERAAEWTLDAGSWDALRKGFAKTYAKARKAAAKARESGSSEDFHDLRKRIKYHWYHTRLLSDVWPELMAVREASAKTLADELGNHHDLAVFEAYLAADPERYGAPRDVETAIGLARGRRARIEAEAWPLCDRLLAQEPKALTAQIGALWHIWKTPRETTA